MNPQVETTLTPMERVVLAMVVDGSTSKVAGERLGISSRTVEFHRANIMQKLGARNVADLMRKVLGPSPNTIDDNDLDAGGSEMRST